MPFLLCTNFLQAHEDAAADGNDGVRPAAAAAVVPDDNAAAAAAAAPHVAFDELLGLRGPLTVLARNVAWLLAFNGAYLGLFAFIPYSVGASVAGALAKYLDGAAALPDQASLPP